MTLGEVKPTVQTQGEKAITPKANLRKNGPIPLVRHLVTAMRPRQWIKNVLVFMAPAAAGLLGSWHIAFHALIAFLLFCVVASGTYLVNDAIDAESDRHHPTKRHRPVAAGVLPSSLALAVGGGLIALSLAGGMIAGPWDLVAIIGAYAALSLTYSIRLKREPVIELAIVASGFVLRAVAGGVATHVPLSSWFLVVTSFGALFVVTGKRSAEYALLGEQRVAHRPVLNRYTKSFLQSTLTLTATVTVTAYCLWAFERAGVVAHAGRHVVWIQLTVIPMILAVLQVLLLLDSGQGGEPEELALRDRLLQGCGVLWLVLMGIGLYA